MVVEGAELDGKVVPGKDQMAPRLELAQSLGRERPGAFPKLIAFVEEARIVRVRAEGLIVGAERFGGLAQDIEITNTEVPPGHGIGGFEFHRLLPEPDRLTVAAAVVEKIAEIE